MFYDTPQLFRYTGLDNNTNFFSFGRDQVEDGVGLRVKSGSVLPEDPIAKKEETIQTMAILDPLSIAEGLGKENPMEWAKRNFYYRVLPDKYMTEILKIDPNVGSGQDPSALQHIEMLNQGQQVPPEASPTKEHIATHQTFIEAPEFKSLPPEIQELHLMHIQAEVDTAKGQMGMGDERPGAPADTTQAPSPDGTDGGQPNGVMPPPQQEPSNAIIS